MTDRIEPALTPEEWKDRRFYRDRSHGSVSDKAVVVLDQARAMWVGYDDDNVGTHVDFEDIPALIALANAALPDSDLRKITREKLERVRQLMGTHEDDEKAFLDALASYLPPS